MRVCGILSLDHIQILPFWQEEPYSNALAFPAQRLQGHVVLRGWPMTGDMDTDDLGTVGSYLFFTTSVFMTPLLRKLV